MANSLHLKASRTQILNSLPNKSFGKEGDIVVANIKGKGVYLCIKTGGMWYTANRMSEISKIDKIPLNIIAKKIRIKNIKNSSEGNKFVVSEGDGELKYRDSEQLLSDLDSDALFIDYKTSYCSLGQYTNKEECEANNGTWYYSENESHDSISSTAENQLLTLGQSIGGLDSEPTLLYDGSTLEIKRNSDYDDNWQTSAQDTLLKLSYDSTNNTTVGISSGGDLTITPSGGDTTLSSSTLTIGTIAEVGSDTDKILMSDSGVVKYVDGATLRGYIGAGTSSVGALDDLSDVTYSSGDLTISSLDKIVSGELHFDSSGNHILDSTNSTNNHTSGTLFANGGTAYGVMTVHHAASTFALYEGGGSSSTDYFQILTGANGATDFSTYDDAAAAAHLGLLIDGNINIEPNGHVEFDGCGVGFDLVTPTYDATNTVVDFKTGNKQFVTFGSGNITNLKLNFPATSGNFVVLIKQDGTGSRTIANYKAYDSAGNAANGSASTKFAGGSNPTLTTDANHVDIISIFWDADNEIAYGVPSLDFQF